MRSFQRVTAFLGASLLLVCLVNGCSGNQPLGEGQPDKLPGRDTKPGKNPEAVPADQSLGDDKYIEMGMPAHDRDWNGADMAKAARVLSLLDEKTPGCLPRYRSERSGSTFARIVTTENHSFAQNRTLPIQTRFGDFNDYMESTNRILKTYLAAFLKKDMGDSELVELFGAQMRNTVVLFGLLDEFIPTLRNDDPTYQVRMKAVEKMKHGLSIFVSGGFQTLTERNSYRASELTKLVGYMKKTYPAIVPRLTPASRSEVLTRLREMAADDALKDLRPDLEELQALVRKSVDKAQSLPSAILEPKSTTKKEMPRISVEDLGFSARDRGIDLKIHRENVGDLDQSGWCTTKSTGGGFSASFPNRFNDFTITAKTKDNVELKMFVLGTKDDRDVKFTVFATRRSDGKNEGDVLEKIANRFEGTEVKGKKAITLGGMKGIELTVVNPSSSAALRLYKSSTTVYQLIVEAPASLSLAQLDKDVKRFFDSFSVQERD